MTLFQSAGKLSDGWTASTDSTAELQSEAAGKVIT
jgi:hypothetical protein